MNTYKTKGTWVSVVGVLLSCTIAQAQQKTVEDKDLLNLLETVQTEPASAEAQKNASIPATAATASEGAGMKASVVEGEQAEVEQPKVEAVEMESLESAEASSTENLISVRLNKVSLEDAINLFAQLSGANIIVPELTEAAQISVNLKDVEWRPALQSILDTYNYELYQRVSGSNVYSVRRRPAGAPEPQVVETFTLRYATVPNAAKLVRELLPTDAKVSEFASRNMIVVKSTESSLSEVRAVLESVDKVRQQVFIESKFMELSDTASKKLGIDWQSLDAYNIKLGPNQGAYGREFSTENPSENLWQDLTDGSATFAGDGEYAVLTSVLTPDDFNLVLSAMKDDSGINIVSNPKIIVANEEQANISIVRKEPNLRQSRQQALNDTPDTITYELDPERPFFEYGIRLDVTPSVNTSSNITVRITPSLTRFVADKPAGDNTYPIIDEKSVDTTFNLASGQTAAIGGLTEVEERETESKIPVLGSIPLLGRLFSWKHTVNGQSETIIFVTVGLANTDLIETDASMPDAAELARQRIIADRYDRTLRDQKRAHFEAQENDKLQDMLQEINEKEAKRVERREREMQQ